jgi:pimeloyl-ACP methyl ester carboxylesterase
VYVRDVRYRNRHPDAASPPPVNDDVIVLADGRSVGLAEFGDPDGPVVVWCHGGLSSRLDAGLAHRAAVDHGIRLISLDRPGIGRSSRRPGDTVMTWPSIVAACTRRLGVQRFAVAGWSAADPYALACGYALADRVPIVATVAGMYPVTGPARRRELGLAADRLLISLSARSPRAAKGLLAGFAAIPDRILWSGLRHTGGPAERAVITDERRGILLGMVHEAFRSGPAGVVADYRAFGGDWGFPLSLVAVPVSVWHGDQDALVPPDDGVRLADALPDARLEPVPGGGHYLHASHGRAPMNTLRSALD